MSWTLGLAVYVVIWWTMLFAILPFGIRSQQEQGAVVPGSEPGAPHRPRIGLRLAVNTLVAGVLWLAVDFFYLHYYLER